jgi:HK97 gp10 family phage protein
MAAIKFDFSGIDRLIKKVDAKKNSIGELVADELNAWATETVTEAKKNCPVDEGFLRNSIAANFADSKNLTTEITVGANYGAYLEFGTRKFAANYVGSLPKEWKQLAGQFKGGGGKKGSFNDFLLKIIKWVKRKGISGTFSVKTQRRTGKKANRNSEDLAAAYPIALKILRTGIKPQPYLYPAVLKTSKKLKENIKKAIIS